MATQRTSHSRIPKPNFSACFSFGKYSKSTAKTTSTSKTTSTPDLPFDVVQLILSGLSIKSLFRFKSVSKSWNTIISDPAFIPYHHQKTKSRNSQDLFFLYNSAFYDEWLRLVKLEDRKLETVETKLAPRDSRYVLCYCDGVLLYAHSINRYVVWNPYAGTEIAMLDIPYSLFHEHPSTLGICRNPTDGDFRVVAICNKRYAVYSCKNRSWNKAKQRNVVSTHPSSPQGGGISVDGAIYWVFWRCRKDNNMSFREITYYDPRKDKFKILHKPKDVHDEKKIYVVDLGGSLCLYCYGENMHTVRIWKKEKGIDKNCWEMLMIIPNVEIWWCFPLLPQCLLGNKIVIRTNYNCNLVVYSPLENKFEKFEQFEGTWVYERGLIPYRPLPLPTIKST